MAKCKLIPYTGRALRTYEKICEACGIKSAYIVNNEYNYNEKVKVYINARGYLHILQRGKRNVVFDFLLTSNDTFKETARYYPQEA